MNFDQLAHKLDQTYMDCYASGREEALEDFGRKHSADIVAALSGELTLNDLVEAAKIGAASYWAKQVARGMDVSGRPKFPK